MRKQRIDLGSDGELQCAGIDIRPGEMWRLYARVDLNGNIWYEAVILSEAEDHIMQDWIIEMIEANVSSQSTPLGDVYPLQELAEFIQRRLMAQDPLYTCHEIPLPEEPHDPDID